MPDDAAYLLCAEDAAATFFDAAAAAGSTAFCAGAGDVGDDDDDDDDDGCCSSVADDQPAASSIAELIGGEAEYSPRPDYPDRLRSRSIDPAARAESVEWILKVQEYYGFLPLTAYLAVNYMDRFLSLHRLPVLFRGTFWLRQWAKLQRNEESVQRLVQGAQSLEVASLRIFNTFG